jgi:hypothetical protein
LVGYITVLDTALATNYKNTYKTAPIMQELKTSVPAVVRREAED